MPPDDENVGLRRRKSKYNDDAHNDFRRGGGKRADPECSPSIVGSKAKAERTDWIAHGPCGFVG